MKPLTLDELIAEFEFLGDWDAQCDYLIDLGFELPKLAEEQMVEKNRVHGCQSQVWLIPEIEESSPPVVRFQAQSDALIVSGLIAVLTAIYSGKTAPDILETDIDAIFLQLGLNTHLSPQRRNGLYGMVKRIQSVAENAVASS